MSLLHYLQMFYYGYFFGLLKNALNFITELKICEMMIRNN